MPSSPFCPVSYLTFKFYLMSNILPEYPTFVHYIASYESNNYYPFSAITSH